MLKPDVLDRYQLSSHATSAWDRKHGALGYILFTGRAVKSCLQAPDPGFMFTTVNPICLAGSSNGQRVRLTAPR